MEDFEITGAHWALNQIEKCLPFSSRNCDCSADIFYYLGQIRKKLDKMEEKNGWS